MANASSADAAWHALIRDRSIQFDFPAMPAAPRPPGWLTRLLAFLASHGGGLRTGAWVMLAVLVLAVLIWLVRLYLRRGIAPLAGNARAVVPWQPSAERARLLLADADALAAQGKFGDAAHLLLRISVQEIADRRPGLVAPSLTSREIGGLSALSPRAREIFAAIAMVVERALFGGRILGAEDFALCRAAFEGFIVPQAWSAA